MQTNKHLHLWFPTMGLHALHQVVPKWIYQVVEK